MAKKIKPSKDEKIAALKKKSAACEKNGMTQSAESFRAQIRRLENAG